MLLTGQVNHIIRDEAQMCIFDPSYSINYIVSGACYGQLGAASVPALANSTVDINYSAIEYLPSDFKKLICLLS